ncbi:flagellar hook assembly protein FlgD [Dissulfurispira sp.]|uniref:flagellar hook assembly protein FlgD n=1 Tax=Dissulfurispira sp. TaxID=2817609 RepID=UPI002FDA7117
MGYMTPILSDSSYTKTVDSQGNTKVKKELGKDDFLNLLIAQLKNQDPLNPMKDQEFIAQLATFSSLEQVSNMNKNLEEFLKQQSYQNATVASTMIGKEITSIEGEKGVVASVKIEDSGVYLSVNGKNIAFNDIKEIKNPSTV